MALCGAAFAAAAGVTTPALASHAVAYGKVSHACAPPKAGDATCFALVRRPVPSSEAGQPGVEAYLTGDGASKGGPAGGLTPGDLASAYDYEAQAGGAGQTVAIVDANDDPDVESDLATFDAEYGLAECTKANGCFTKVSQTGSTTVLPKADKTGWSVEISLDVETVHSVCPGCKILLVEADSESFANLAAGVNEAAKLGATEISNSYGGPEEATVDADYKAAYNHPGVVVAAATGDDGYDDWTYLNEGDEPPGVPNFPATLPTVVSVGGTTLKLNAEGRRESETVWNGNGPLDDSEYAEGATGGGCSTLFAAQAWQQQAPGYETSGCAGKRLAADVAGVADPNTGFDIYDSYDCGKECERFKDGKNWITIGGTSLATPLISALSALAGGSHGVEYPSLTLYGHLAGSTDLYDVTEGGSGFCDGAPESECGHPNALGAIVEGDALHVDCEYTSACDAASGYDGPSGVGAPNGLGLFQPLLPTARLEPSRVVTVDEPVSFSGAESSDPYPGGSITDYSWGWGDGTTESSGATPEHIFAKVGEYQVSLTVTDNYGFTSVPATEAVKVRSPKELEEEQARKAEEEEEAAAHKKAEEEAAAHEKAEEEAAAHKAEEEAAAHEKAEEEQARKAEEEAAARTKEAQEEQARIAEEEAAAKKVEEEATLRELESTRSHEEAIEEEAAEKKDQEEAEQRDAVNEAEEAARAVTRKAEEEAAKSSLIASLQGVSPFQSSKPTAVPDVTLVAGPSRVGIRGAFTLKLSCPADETSCAGSIALRTTAAAKARLHARPQLVTVATGVFTIPGGSARALALHLTRRYQALLDRTGVLHARVTILAHDTQGGSHATQTLVTLRLANRLATRR